MTVTAPYRTGENTGLRIAFEAMIEKNSGFRDKFSGVVERTQDGDIFTYNPGGVSPVKLQVGISSTRAHIYWLNAGNREERERLYLGVKGVCSNLGCERITVEPTSKKDRHFWTQMGFQPGNEGEAYLKL